MNIVKLELKKLFQGARTKENLKIYNELLVEANTELGLLKLPESFRCFSDIVKKVSYKEMTELMGEDPTTVKMNKNNFRITKMLV